MKFIFVAVAVLFVLITQAQSIKGDKLFIDVHHLGAGNVTAKDVAAAHQKDLAVQDRFGVQFQKYWVDEKKGLVYCLSAAKDSARIAQTHKAAHGLMPQEVHPVTEGEAALATEGKTYFLDVHQLGAGKVTAADVAKAHEKDLAVQTKYGVSFINYWVDEKAGFVYCLSQAGEAGKVVATHKEAHGLLPHSVVEVKQGQ